MENQNNLDKNGRSLEEKEELILKYRQSGKTRKKFCEDEGLNHNSFDSWHKQSNKKKKEALGFRELKLTPGSLFAEVYSSQGVKIVFYQSIPLAFFQSLIDK